MVDPFIRGIVGKEYGETLPAADLALVGPRLHAASRAVLRAVRAAVAHHNVPRLTERLDRFLAQPSEDSTVWRREAYRVLGEVNGDHAAWWCREGVRADTDWDSDEPLRRYLSVVLVLYEAQTWLEDYETATLEDLGARAARVCRWGVRAGNAGEPPADGYGLLAAVLAAGADTGQRAALRRLSEGDGEGG